MRLVVEHKNANEPSRFEFRSNRIETQHNFIKIEFEIKFDEFKMSSLTLS